jgi:prevent-host-death family protein
MGTNQISDEDLSLGTPVLATVAWQTRLEPQFRENVVYLTGRLTGHIMQTYQASEAKTHFLRILDEVERGESVIITRHGKTVARISPEAAIDRERVQRAVESIREIRKRTKPVALAEIFSARDEGRM